MISFFVHLLLLVSSNSVHLHQDFGLDSARGFVVLTTALSAQRIDFVNENDGRTVETGHFEQDADQFLGISAILAGEGCGRHVEELGAAFSGDSLGQQCLSSSGRSIEQHSGPRTTNSTKVIRNQHRKNNSLCKKKKKNGYCENIT